MASGSFTAKRNSPRSWAATTYAHAGPASGSRTAASHRAAFDGVNRHDYFPRMKTWPAGERFLAGQCRSGPFDVFKAIQDEPASDAPHGLYCGNLPASYCFQKSAAGILLILSNVFIRRSAAMPVSTFNGSRISDSFIPSSGDKSRT